MLRESKQIIEILANVPEGNREAVLREVFQTIARKVRPTRKPVRVGPPAGMPGPTPPGEAGVGETPMAMARRKREGIPPAFGKGGRWGGPQGPKLRPIAW